MKIAIAAAGTGGHVFPALAVADVLVERGHEVVFFGGDRMADRAVPAAGHRLVSAPISGLSRESIRANRSVPGQVMRAARLWSGVLKQERVAVMLAMGGYVTGPATLAALRRRVPIILHEQNAVPGLANRLAAPLARRILVAFEQATRLLPRAQVVGNPLRPGVVVPVDRVEALKRYDVGPDRPVVGVTGGSQGARVINERVAEMVKDWRAGPVGVIHLVGSSSDIAAAGNPLVEHRVVEYEDQMQFFYSAADLVIARAGASTVSELAATDTPSILVPYAFGTASHQAANAGVLADAGAARILPQERLAELAAMVADLVADADSLGSMSRAASSLAVGDAAEQVANIVLEEASRG